MEDKIFYKKVIVWELPNGKRFDSEEELVEYANRKERNENGYSEKSKPTLSRNK